MCGYSEPTSKSKINIADDSIPLNVNHDYQEKIDHCLMKSLMWLANAEQRMKKIQISLRSQVDTEYIYHSMNSVLVSYPDESQDRTICMCSGTLLQLASSMSHDTVIRRMGKIGGMVQFRLTPKLSGGKGGFGKLLRAQKNIGKRTDNFDSARDLEGRRIRIAKKEERIEDWKAQKEKNEKSAPSQPTEKHIPSVVLDEKYLSQLARIDQEKSNAVLEGLAAVPAAGIPAVPKRKPLRFDDDSDNSDSLF